MKKFDNYKSNLAVLSRAGEQDLSNEFIPAFQELEKSIEEKYRDVLEELA